MTEQLSLPDRVRAAVGAVGLNIFLWSIGTSLDDYGEDLPVVPVDKAVSFIRDVMEDWNEFLGIDGVDLQDLALKYGILIPEKRTEICMEEGCRCSEEGMQEDEEWECYHLAEWAVKK